LVVDIAQLDMQSLFSSVASRGRGISTCIIRTALHIVNIDFELNLALNVNFYYCCRQLNKCTNTFLASLFNFVPFWCCCITARVEERFILQGKVATLIS